MEEISQETKDRLSFEDLGLDQTVLKAVSAKGFTEPTPIQVLAIPRLLNGDANVIAKARTGTGKTAAFGLPLVQDLRADKQCPRALVLVPTRELAVQVETEIASFRTEAYPRTTVVYGGAPIVEQLRNLRRGVEIVVGTPGRVIDHLERRSLDLSQIEYFILDEADEMLNMGFIEDIEAIFGRANPDARVLMFSATMPKAILSIASNFMGDYEIVEEEFVPEETALTDQFYWIVREADKTEAIVRLIDIAPDFYGLVFCQTRADADAVAKELDERHYQAAALHGDIAQSQREKILGRFRSKKTRILVATDVAARGIDIEGITHVVNYALPYDGPTYTHRIGRTGRAGARGTAITFVRPEERRRLGYLRHHTNGAINEGHVPSIKKVLNTKRGRLMDAAYTELATYFPSTVADEAGETVAVDATRSIPEEWTSFAKKLCEGRDAETVLAAVLDRQLGSLLSAEQYREIREVQGSDAFHIRLYVGIGRRDGLTRRGIAQFFRDLVGVPERLVDRIEVLDAFSLATLPADAARAALDLSKQRRNVPHMHIDVRSGGGDFHAGPRGNRSGRFRGQGPRDSGQGPRDSGRGRGGRSFDRNAENQHGRDGSGRRSSRTYSRGPKPAGAEAYRKKNRGE